MSKDRSDIQRQSKDVDSAYRAGDLDALRHALGNPPDFPNSHLPHNLGVGAHPLEYAIYWSPIPFVEKLIELGADTNYEDAAGFPSLFAALSSGRIDALQIVKLLLDSGADVGQRGHNDWTPLHYAVAERDLDGVKMLLGHGADPALKTRIDDCTSPLEDAEAIGFNEAVALMRHAAIRGAST